MNRSSTRSLADCVTKDDYVTFLEIVSIHTKDTILAGLARTWKHLTDNTDDSHTVRNYGHTQTTRLGLREKQIVARINERLAQIHPSLGKITI